MSPVAGDYEVRGWDGPGPGQSGRLVPPIHPQQRGQAGAGARGHRQPRPARRHQGVHHVQIVTASPVQTATVFCCTNLPQPRSLVDTLVRLWCDSSPVLWTEPTLWCYHLQFLPDTDNLLTPCWKWQISSFQPAPTIIAPNWANERRARECVSDCNSQ